MAKAAYLCGHLATAETKMIVTATAIPTVSIQYQLVPLRRMELSRGIKSSVHQL